jgi:multiple sugar transport system permease protein
MMTLRKHGKQIIPYIIIGAYVIISLFPIAWMISTSLKPPGEAFEIPPRWIPESPTIQNYHDIFDTSQGSNLGKYTLNSILVASTVTILCIAFGTLAAYSFSRYRVWGSNLILLMFLASRMIAPTALIIPFMLIARSLEIMDTKFVLVAADLYLQLPLYVWLMKSYIDGIPKEIDQAAKIDGCNNFQVFYQIILKISLPGIVSFGILVFLFTWNDFIFPLTLTITENSKTLPVGMIDFFQDTQVEWTQLSAAGTIAIVPVVIFLSFFQRYLVRGIIQGAIKG